MRRLDGVCCRKRSIRPKNSVSTVNLVFWLQTKKICDMLGFHQGASYSTFWDLWGSAVCRSQRFRESPFDLSPSGLTAYFVCYCRGSTCMPLIVRARVY